MTSTLLVMKNIHRQYRSTRTLFSSRSVTAAVADLSLEIGRGEIVALVGESGSGKSTTGRLALGLESPDSGQVTFDGEPLPRSGSPSWRRLRSRMQMVFQDPLASLDARLPAIAQVMEPITIHAKLDRSERRGRALTLLTSMGLTQTDALKLPRQLSGGQRQRVALARALAGNPEFLVCDEVVSALDVAVQVQILSLLAEIKQRFGTAILFISHDLKAVARISDRIAVMYLGEIVEEGTTAEILANPRHPYTQALISAVPSIDQNRADRIVLKGDLPSPTARPPGCVFHPRCPIALEACGEIRPRLVVGGPSGRRVACHLPYGEMTFDLSRQEAAI